MNDEFMREARYVVLKSADVMKCLTVSELIELRRIQAKAEEYRAEIGKPPLDCVIVEADWPECEPTWKAIEARVTGAQPAPSVPEGWMRAIDEALVIAHIGVANAHDTYEQAKTKLDNLIGFNVNIATDPAVNGGWKLMPIEPTKEIYECFAAYDGTSYSNPFDFDDFSADYGFAIAAASKPEGE